MGGNKPTSREWLAWTLCVQVWKNLIVSQRERVSGHGRVHGLWCWRRRWCHCCPNHPQQSCYCCHPAIIIIIIIIIIIVAKCVCVCARICLSLSLSLYGSLCLSVCLSLSLSLSLPPYLSSCGPTMSFICGRKGACGLLRQDRQHHLIRPLLHTETWVVNRFFDSLQPCASW